MQEILHHAIRLTWEGEDGFPLTLSWWWNCEVLDMCERTIKGIRDERVSSLPLEMVMQGVRHHPRIRPLTGWEFPAEIIRWNMQLVRRPESVTRRNWYLRMAQSNPCEVYNPKVVALYRDDMEIIMEEEWPIMNTDRMGWYLTHLHKGFVMKARPLLYYITGR